MRKELLSEGKALFFENLPSLRRGKVILGEKD